MMSRTAVFGLISLFGIIALPRVGSAQAKLTVDQAVETALRNNPELAALRAEVQAAKARTSGASRLFRSNPQLSGTLGSRASQGTRLIEYEAELSQEIEIFGQRGARLAGARATLAGSEAHLQSRRSEIAAQVRQAFARALAAEELLVVAEENLALARQTVKAAARRLEVGDGSRIEVNTAQLEVGRAARELNVARKARVSAYAELRLLLALDPTAELRLRGELRGPAKAPPATDTLLRAAANSRSDLVAARKALERARADQAFAGRDWLPRPRVGARFEREEGEQVFLGTLAFDLPLFNHNQEGRGTAAAEVTRAERELEAAERRAQQEVLVAVARVKAASEVVESFEGDVVEAMQDNLKLINAAYAAGKIDLFELVVIRRDTLEARRGYIECLEELRMAEADLGRALGLGAPQ